MIFWVLVFVAVAIAAVAVLSRLAAVDVARWHPLDVVVQDIGDVPGTGRFLAVRKGNAADFARLFQVAQATDRTRLIGGSAEAGQATFETRSRFFGFPDYTTISLVEGQIQIFARLRFGRDDFGVNKARVLNWLQAADMTS